MSREVHSDEVDHKQAEGSQPQLGKLQSAMDSR